MRTVRTADGVDNDALPLSSHDVVGAAHVRNNKGGR